MTNPLATPAVRTETPPSPHPDPAGPVYRALALQVNCYAINQCPDRETARAKMMGTIARLARTIPAAKAFLGQDVRLAVLPEYFLTSFPMGEPIQVWRDKAALEIGGPEYEALGKIAQDNKIYLAGNGYEQDPNFPDLYFQASYLIDDRGAVVLRYRRLVSMFAPSPWDVWDKYLDIYGFDSIFPVADTDLGRISAIASEEILYPEIARAHALRGAEIFVHSSSETAALTSTPKNVCKVARAIENLAYVVSANSASIQDYPIPAQSTDAHSQIVDYTGKLLVETGFGETMNGCAELDVRALRRYRLRPGMGNLLARQNTGLWTEAFAGIMINPKNTLLENGKVKVPDRSYYLSRQASAIKTLQDRGTI